MNDRVETTVIGSYPVSLHPLSMMNDYYQGRLPSWKPYIKKAVSAMCSAGIDLLSDGQTRDPFIHIFARGLQGCRIRTRAEVVGPIDVTDSITKKDVSYVSTLLPEGKKTLGLIVGPSTLSESMIDFFYHDKKELAFAFTDALKKEIRYIEPFVDMISIDEPFLSNYYPEYEKELIARLTQDITCPTRLHVCGDVTPIVHHLVDYPVDILSHEFKATPELFDVFPEYPSKIGICLGSVRSDKETIESVSNIKKHICRGREIFESRLKQLSPDCGLRMLSERSAYKKLQHLVSAGEALYG